MEPQEYTHDQLVDISQHNFGLHYDANDVHDFTVYGESPYLFVKPVNGLADRVCPNERAKISKTSLKVLSPTTRRIKNPTDWMRKALQLTPARC